MICGGSFDLEMSLERVWGLSYHQMARKALSILSKRRPQLGEMTDLNACPKTPPVSVPEVVRCYLREAPSVLVPREL